MRQKGNTLIEMVLVMTFLGIVIFSAYFTFSKSAESTLTSDSSLMEASQVLDSTLGSAPSP